MLVKTKLYSLYEKCNALIHTFFKRYQAITKDLFTKLRSKKSKTDDSKWQNTWKHSLFDMKSSVLVLQGIEEVKLMFGKIMPFVLRKCVIFLIEGSS